VVSSHVSPDRQATIDLGRRASSWQRSFEYRRHAPVTTTAVAQPPRKVRMPSTLRWAAPWRRSCSQPARYAKGRPALGRWQGEPWRSSSVSRDRRRYCWRLAAGVRRVAAQYALRFVSLHGRSRPQAGQRERRL